MQSNRIHRYAAAALAAVPLFVATPIILTVADGPTARSPVLDIPVACPLHCDDCQSLTEHFTHAQSGGGYAGLLHAGCFPGSCGVHSCEPEGPVLGSLEDAWSALGRATDEELPIVLEEYARFLRFNPDRHAVQVVDCRGDIFAHVPLSVEQVTALAD